MGESKHKKNTTTYKGNKAKSKPNNKFFGWFLGIVVVLLVGALVVINSLSPSKADEPPVEGKTYEISTVGQPVMGNKDAKVEIVEFGDFKCPSCRQFETDVFPKLKEKYIDSGKAKISFINFSFMSETFKLSDNDSKRAALFGEAVYKQNPEAFWTYYQHLYEQQGDEREIWATEEMLSNIVKDIPGIDVEKVKKEVQEGLFDKELDNDHKIVYQLGITSTPTVFVNGNPVGAPDFDNVSKLIEAELAK